MAENLTSMISN